MESNQYAAQRLWDQEVKKFLSGRGCGSKKLKQTRGDASGYNAGARAGNSVAIGGALTSTAGSLKG